VDGIGESAIHSRCATTVELSSINSRDHETVSVNCYVMDKPMTVNLGADAKKLRQQLVDRNLKLWADPQPGECTKVEDLHFIHTIFGWSVGGVILCDGTQAMMMKVTTFGGSYRQAPGMTVRTPDSP